MRWVFDFPIIMNIYVCFFTTCCGLAGALALSYFEWRVDFTHLYPLYKRRGASVETISLSLRFLISLFLRFLERDVNLLEIESRLEVYPPFFEFPLRL